MCGWRCYERCYEDFYFPLLCTKEDFKNQRPSPGKINARENRHLMLEKAGGFEGHTYTFPMMNRDRGHVHQLNKSYTFPMMNRDRLHTFIDNIRVTIFCNHKLTPYSFSQWFYVTDCKDCLLFSYWHIIFSLLLIICQIRIVTKLWYKRTGLIFSHKIISTCICRNF